MKALQKASKFLSDYTSVVVIAIAIVTFFVPSMMGWVNYALFTDMVANKFTSQSIIIGVIMFSMGLTLTTEDFKILAQRPFDICVGAIAQYLIMPFLAFALTKLLHLPDGIALGLILVGCCPGGVSSNIMSYLCGGDVAFSVGMTTVSTLVSPVMTPLMVSFLARGTQITIKGLPMFESVVFPLKLSINLFSIERERFFSFLDKIIISNINRVIINPTPDATLNIWTMTGIRILAQRSSFITIKETNGPRLNLLSFHNFRNSGE